MYIYLCMCVRMHVCMYAFTYVSCTFTRMCVCIHACVHVKIHVFIFVRMYTCMYLYAYMHACEHAHMHVRHQKKPCWIVT